MHLTGAAVVRRSRCMQVLVWSAYLSDNFDRIHYMFVSSGGGSGFTKSAIYDPMTGKISKMTVSNTNHDMFCPGAPSPCGHTRTCGHAPTRLKPRCASPFCASMLLIVTAAMLCRHHFAAQWGHCGHRWPERREDERVLRQEQVV
jgi:hypothetical protein